MTIALSPTRLEDFLMAEGLLTREQVQQIQLECKASAQSFFQILLKKETLDDPALGQAIARYAGTAYLDPATLQPDPEAMALLPKATLIAHQFLPLRLDPVAKRLELLVADPTNLKLLDEVALITGLRVVPRVTAPRYFQSMLRDLNRNTSGADDAIARAEAKIAEGQINYSSINANQALSDEIATDDAPVVQLVNAIQAEAVYRNASDIHIESYKNGAIVRFRIDGILIDVRTIPEQLGPAVISRIKVISGMDIAERRRPQDGRMTLRTPSGDIDMRVNTLAVQYGESVVIRLLRSSATSVGLEKLGLGPAEVTRLMRMIKAPNGIILVTGPTGSGKTTTLYSCLRELNSRTRKIITIEDPIEYPLIGINQTQISHKAGLDFPVSLRAIMRQDPDVVMVGEIRDRETLEAAMHAALTGHLVFSTIHTNSAAKTITRLREMGAPSYMISSTVTGIIAQRLIRSNCPECRASYTANEEELKLLGFSNTSESLTLTKGAGCPACEFTGYKGRMGLYEIMEMGRDLQELVDVGASAYSVQDAAIKDGMTTLGMDGERKIASGQTTVEEVTRVLGMNW